MHSDKSESGSERMNRRARELMQDPAIETHAQFFERFTAEFPSVRHLNNFVSVVCGRYGYMMFTLLHAEDRSGQWKAWTPEQREERVRELLQDTSNSLAQAMRSAIERELFLRAAVDETAQRAGGKYPPEFRSGNEDLLRLYVLHIEKSFDSQPEDVRERILYVCNFFYDCARSIILDRENPREFREDILR